MNKTLVFWEYCSIAKTLGTISIDDNQAHAKWKADTLEKKNSTCPNAEHPEVKWNFICKTYWEKFELFKAN